MEKEQTSTCPVYGFILLAKEFEEARHSPKILLKFIGTALLTPVIMALPGFLVNLSHNYNLLRFELIISACLFWLFAIPFFSFTFGSETISKRMLHSKIISGLLTLVLLGASFAIAFFISGLIHPLWKSPEFFITNFLTPLLLGLIWLILIGGILYFVYGD